jgi:acetylglutamate kinase
VKRTRSHTPEPSTATAPSTATEPLVVKIGGAVAEDADAIDRILSDMAAFAVPGRRMMLVHGGGRSISDY